MQAAEIHHPILKPVAFDATDGLSPDEAAILAVLANPVLRAARDARAVSAGQVIQAGLLPNPDLSVSADFADHSREPLPGRRNALADQLGAISGRLGALSYAAAPTANLDGAGLSALSSAIHTPIKHGGRAKLYTGSGLGLAWDVTSLLTRPLEVKSAKAHAASVDLDVAWQEWQVAQAAKLQVYKLAAVRQELALQREIEQGLKENADLIKKAADAHEKTGGEEAAAQAALNDAHLATLALEQEAEKERLAFNQALGFAPDADLQPERGASSPYLAILPERERILEALEEQRLDLLALKKGYESEDATVRAAVRAQFPKVNFGLSHGRDTSNIGSVSPSITIGLPVFDRNQGQIAVEEATRQQLFDEYTSRVFEARAEVAAILSDIESTRKQIDSAEASSPALERLAASYEKAAREGNVDILSYYDARNAVSARRMDILKLNEALAELGIGLELATGRYFPRDSGDVPGPQPAVVHEGVR